MVIEYLNYLFQTGLSFSAINTARSMLSTFLVNDYGVTIGNSSLVKRFMKGVFEKKPPVSRYNVIWDVRIVLDYLKNLITDMDTPLDIITFKLIMLLALATKQRAQTLHAISVDDIQLSDSLVVIPIRKLLKHTRSNNYKFALYLNAYSEKSICVVNVLKLYLNKTKLCRGDHKQLFISYIKPFNPVSKDTISRWIKKVLTEAGIDTTKFKSHSTRAASASDALRNDVPIDSILKSAAWSNALTFHKYYNKVILPYTV